MSNLNKLIDLPGLSRFLAKLKDLFTSKKEFNDLLLTNPKFTYRGFEIAPGFLVEESGNYIINNNAIEEGGQFSYDQMWHLFDGISAWGMQNENHPFGEWRLPTSSEFTTILDSAEGFGSYSALGTIQTNDSTISCIVILPDNLQCTNAPYYNLNEDFKFTIPQSEIERLINDYGYVFIYESKDWLTSDYDGNAYTFGLDDGTPVTNWIDIYDPIAYVRFIRPTQLVPKFYEKPATGIPASDLSDAVKYADELEIPITLDEQSETTAYVLPDDFNNIFTYKPRVITVTIPGEGQTMSFIKITEMPNYDQQDHSILLYGVSTGDTNIVLQIAENAPTVDGKRQISVETMEVENTSHKVTTISSSSDDMQYPSAKCVYDAIQASNTPEIFWATYGTTTAAEIDAAVAAGKEVLLYKDGNCFRFQNKVSDRYYFVSASNFYFYTYILFSNNTWSNLFQSRAEQAELKVTAFQSTPDNTHYPSEKLVKDSIDAVDKVFWATYGTTTASEIDAAVAAGKIVACSRDGITYIFTKKIGTKDYFTSLVGTINNYYLTLNSEGNAWSNGSVIFEQTYNKVSTLSGNESDTAKYLSTKGSYDAIHPAIATTQPSGGFLPNIMYNLGTLSGNTTFALATPADANVVNHYYWTFDTGSTAPTITWPSSITWFGGSAPYIDASKHYEISVLNGIGVAMEV